MLKHGAISFLIIRFSSLDKTFLLDTEYLSDFLKNNDRKSIPLSYIELNGHMIDEGYYPRLDYIKLLDKLYFEVIKWIRH